MNIEVEKNTRLSLGEPIPETIQDERILIQTNLE